jgi:alpha-ketoglutarate-dependent taurine dioxygenase
VEHPDSDKPALKSKWAERRKSMKPMPISGSREDLAEVRPLFAGGRPLPLLVEPRLRSMDLFSWVEANMPFVEDRLKAHGGILFRGFGLKDPQDFDRFLTATSVPRMHYMEGATPRSQTGGEKIYTSTEFPADQSIALHNELNYVQTWPMKIWFYCVIPAQSGGETPVADSRKVFTRIDPEVRDELVAKGWMLVRNFGNGFGPAWQTSYRVETREELAAYLDRADVQFEWLDENRMRTRQIRPAIARHPETGETVWFNHVAFWHVSSLEPKLRDLFLAEFGLEDLPYNTYFGDGSPIPDAVVEELRRAYREETVSFPWQEGDVLMLDNMLVAHGRSPYGGERLILTAMGQPCSDRGVTLKH